MVTVSSDGAAVSSGDFDNGVDQNQTVRLGTPFGGGFYTGAHSPYPIKPGTKPIDAVAYIAPARTDNYATGFVQHKPVNEKYAIFINGVNIIDIISGLNTKTATNVGSGATGSRPSAATAGVGAQFYDTTIHKPVWSDGTAWRDAAGVTA